MITRESQEQKDKFPLQYIIGKSGNDENLSITYEFEEGDYIVYVEIEGDSSAKFCDYVFRTYSLDAPLIEDISHTKVHQNFLKDAMSSYAHLFGESKTYAEKGEPNMMRCMGVEDTKTRYGYLYYENNSKESVLKEDIKFSEIDGIEIIGHQISKRGLHVEVQPGEHEIFVLKQVTGQFLLKLSYFSSIHRSTKELIDLVKLKGVQKQIKFGETNHDIFYYVYDDGDGYIWMFDNQSSDVIFEGTFFYTLDNLKIVDCKPEAPDQWKVSLQPGERSYMRMDAVDITRSWGYKCKCSFH